MNASQIGNVKFLNYLASSPSGCEPRLKVVCELKVVVGKTTQLES
jgi:hypothetical protein